MWFITCEALLRGGFKIFDELDYTMKITISTPAKVRIVPADTF